MKQKRFCLTTASVAISALLLHAVGSVAGARPAVQISQATDGQIMALMEAVNARLEASGANFRVDRTEYLTSSGEEGRTVYFNDRTKQLDVGFVPGDPRRGGRTNITFIVDQVDGAVDGLTKAQTTAAIDRAMATWNSVRCATIPITKLPDIPGFDVGFVQFLFGLGGSPFILADIMHAGWMPAGTFPPLVLAASFFIVFTDANNVPTDIDHNGKPDLAVVETLYHHNATQFTWRINANIDVQSVALHEAGHALGLDHFGALFQTDANGIFHYAPNAVMNASYTGVKQSLLPTDVSGYCSLWASWPNR